MNFFIALTLTLSVIGLGAAFLVYAERLTDSDWL